MYQRGTRFPTVKRCHLLAVISAMLGRRNNNKTERETGFFWGNGIFRARVLSKANRLIKYAKARRERTRRGIVDRSETINGARWRTTRTRRGVIVTRRAGIIGRLAIADAERNAFRRVAFSVLQ